MYRSYQSHQTNQIIISLHRYVFVRFLYYTDRVFWNYFKLMLEQFTVNFALFKQFSLPYKQYAFLSLLFYIVIFTSRNINHFFKFFCYYSFVTFTFPLRNNQFLLFSWHHFSYKNSLGYGYWVYGTYTFFLTFWIFIKMLEVFIIYTI